MPRSFDWSPLRDGAERSLKIALGLLVLVAAIIALVGPRSDVALTRIAEEKARQAARTLAKTSVARPSVVSSTATEADGTAIVPMDEAEPSGASAPVRDVPAPGAPLASAETGTLVRVPPLPPLPNATEAKAEAPEVRLRLLPRPIAIDSATFLVERGKVQLTGVVPVAPSRECTNERGAWPCGMQARTALRLWLRARSIRCEVPEDFGKADETIDAECSLGPKDVGEWLVENGWAEARAEGRYTIIEERARKERLGIWGQGIPAGPGTAP